MALLILNSLLVVPDVVGQEQKLLQVTLPEASAHCTEAMEQQLDTELASLREQILMVSGTPSSNGLCMMSAI